MSTKQQQHGCLAIHSEVGGLGLRFSSEEYGKEWWKKENKRYISGLFSSIIGYPVDSINIRRFGANNNSGGDNNV